MRIRLFLRGIPSCVLMERNFALKTVEEMEKVFHKNNTEEKILCVCGSGNNGGDGIAIAGFFFFMDIRLRFMWQEIIRLLPMKPRASFLLHQIIMFRL